MKKKNLKNDTKKHVTKSKMAVLLAFIMTLQLCTSFVSLAYRDYSDYYDVYGGSDSKLKKVTRTYDDGTVYTAEYRYDDRGNPISEKIKEPDGSRSTTSCTYNAEDTLVSETTYNYDAGSKTEISNTTEYSDAGNRIHMLQTSKYSDGTGDSQETWYLDDYAGDIQKSVSSDKEGVVTQTDYTYDAQNRLLSRVTASTDGGVIQLEQQYNEAGAISHRHYYEYDADTQEKYTSDMQLGSEDMSPSIYMVVTDDKGDGGISTTESWFRADDQQPIKQITTNSDGSQFTENYTYNTDGDETLYTKVSSDGTTEKRETIYTKDGKEVDYTDGQGDTTRTSNSSDPKSGNSIYERSENNADGSSSYVRNVRDDSYNMVSYLSKDKTADGTETYTEITYRPDGSSTSKDKAADGTVAVTELDAAGNATVSHQTLPDGTTADITWTRQEDGKVASQVTRYSDGTEDRINDEYSEDGNTIKETESRRNGVTAVTEIQFDNSGKEWGNQTTIFNNGYRFELTDEMLDKNTEQAVFTYSNGDVSQQIMVEKSEGDLNIKTVYRDGTTDEESLSYQDDNYYTLRHDKLNSLQERCNSFINEAWTVLPAETADEAQATPSDAM